MMLNVRAVRGVAPVGAHQLRGASLKHPARADVLAAWRCGACVRAESTEERGPRGVCGETSGHTRDEAAAEATGRANGPLQGVGQGLVQGQQQLCTPMNKRLQRQTRKKPGWYRKRSQNITRAQRAAIRDLFPRYGLELKYGDNRPQTLDFAAIFRTGNDAEVTLEVGFGNGDALVQMATDAPQRNFVGVEWHRASVGNALVAIHARGLDNVRVIHGDAIYLLEKFVRPGSVHTTCVFFPDPWAGDRDACRRMVREQVVRLAAAATTQGGRLHIATDVEEYARWCVQVMTPMLAEGGRQEEEKDGSEVSDWRDCNGPDGWLVERPEWRPLTKYERRGVEQLNHRIFDLLYERT